jgi:hypothetical protein
VQLHAAPIRDEFPEKIVVCRSIRFSAPAQNWPGFCFVNHVKPGAGSGETAAAMPE